jgi:hypothetical protein
VINDPDARALECAKRIPQGGTFLEIGVWRGANTARILKMRPDVQAVCCDPWALASGSYATSGSSDAKLKTKEEWDFIFARAQRNLSPYKGRFSLVRMGSREFAAYAVKETYDVIFIDADHSYEGCGTDIALWRGRAKHWIGGHDYAKESFPGVKRAVDEAFPKDLILGADSTWWFKSV